MPVLEIERILKNKLSPLRVNKQESQLIDFEICKSTTQKAQSQQPSFFSVSSRFINSSHARFVKNLSICAILIDIFMNNGHWNFLERSHFSISLFFKASSITFEVATQESSNFSSLKTLLGTLHFVAFIVLELLTYRHM